MLSSFHFSDDWVIRKDVFNLLYSVFYSTGMQEIPTLRIVDFSSGRPSIEIIVGDAVIEVDGLGRCSRLLVLSRLIERSFAEYGGVLVYIVARLLESSIVYEIKVSSAEFGERVSVGKSLFGCYVEIVKFLD